MNEEILKVSYFPGCTLKNKAKNLDYCARESAKKLGVELEEIENWQCCGGMFTSANDEVGTKMSSIRALADAEAHSQMLVTVCSACHNVIKRTNYQFNNDEKFRDRVVNYSKITGDKQYGGTTKVMHYLELIRDEIGFDKVKECTVNPLKGLKVAPYYGCLLLRPNSEMHTDDPENPVIIENLMSAMGAENVYFAGRNECCGGYESIPDPALAKKRSAAICEAAKSAGADMIVTACPLCKYNLEKSGVDIPVIYFTELMAKAFGIEVQKDG